MESEARVPDLYSPTCNALSAATCFLYEASTPLCHSHCPVTNSTLKKKATFHINHYGLCPNWEISPHHSETLNFLLLIPGLQLCPSLNMT